jgi:hypothetical protein
VGPAGVVAVVGRAEGRPAQDAPDGGPFEFGDQGAEDFGGGEGWHMVGSPVRG